MDESKTDKWKATLETRALKAVLRVLLDAHAPETISYNGNSEKLWRTLDATTSGSDVPAQEWPAGLVVLWDGTGDLTSVAGRNTGEYLNPLTWAICAVNQNPSLRVAVLDCDASRNRSGKFYRMIEALSAVKRPFGLLTDPCECIAALMDMFGDISRKDAKTQREDEDGKAVVELLTQQVKVMLTPRPDSESDGHALANIVGPLVLLGEKKEQKTRKDAKTQGALKTLFWQVGLVGEVTPKAEKERREKQAQSILGERQVRLLMVDDQYEHGWKDWVESMVRGARNCTVEASDKPDAIVEAIAEGLDKVAQEHKSDCRFALVLPDAKPDTETILLFDLRLFSLRSEREEAEFVLNKVLPLCRRFEAQSARARGISGEAGFKTKDGKPIAWHGFTSKELSCAEKWCEYWVKNAPAENQASESAGQTRDPSPESAQADDQVVKPQRNDDAHLIVLSLLPRLLALCDMSVPIILFSSTGSRRNIALLKPYGNIITEFDKPRFTGLESGDLIEATEERFDAALSKASQLLDARRQCRLILSTAETLAQNIAPPGDGSQSPGSRVRYVELFLDESDWSQDDPWFSLGGCFAVFDAEDLLQASAKADRFDDWLVQQGVRYYDSRGVGVTPSDSNLRTKGVNLLTRIQSYRDCGDAPSSLGLVRLRIERTYTGDSKGPLFDVRDADNRYHLALKAILESFLCDSIPALSDKVPPEDVVISVFPGTRVVRIGQHYQDDVMTRFGLKRLGTTPLFYSFDRSQVYPVVADILDTHAVTRRTHRLVGVQLPYRNGYTDLPEYFRCSKCGKAAFFRQIEPTVPSSCPQCSAQSPDWRTDYRALHYLADEVLTEFPEQGAHRQYDVLFGNEVEPGEFDEILDGHLHATLTASRHLDLGNLSDAVASFEAPPDRGRKPRVSSWLCKRMLLRLPEMTGEDLARISQRLVEISAPNHSLRAKSAAPRVEQTSQSVAPGRINENSYDILKRKWRVKQFDSAGAYRASGERWNEQQGFDVRVAKVSKKVTVFADLAVVGSRLLPGFVEPFARTLFVAGGGLCGVPLFGEAPHAPQESAVAVPASLPPIVQAPAIGGSEELTSKWRVKRFKNPFVYRDSAENWHEKTGFDVRRTKNGKVLVFADLSVVDDSELDGFKEPDESLFSPHGTPGGWPIPEADLRPSAGGNCGRQ